MKNFIEHNFTRLKRIDSDKGRVYETPEGAKYPSVTSVVGLYKAQAIQEWRNRVGHEEANRISSRASSRGTAIHSLCEEYLKTGKATPSIFDHEMYTSLVPHLDEIDNIHALESPLYSNYLKVAGTVDCVAEYKGKLHIIDFKTSSRVKTRDDIHDYFMQTSAYAVMFEELTGIPVPRVLIIMGVDHMKEPLTFSEKRNDWIGDFMKIREDYRKWKGF